jgi:hypothetical protein
MKRSYRAQISLVVAALALAGTASATIVKGRPADEKTTKNSIYIYDRNSGNMCTGVLVHERVLLTAGHCLTQARAEDLKFSNRPTAGSLQSFPIDSIGTPEEYHAAIKGVQLKGAGAFDIGYVLFTESVLHDLQMTESDLPKLSVTNEKTAQLLSSGNLRLIGYGLISGYEKAEVSTAEKRQLSVKAEFIPGEPVLEAHSLEKGKTPCFGDSGSGLFARGADGTEVFVGTLTSILAGGRLAAKYEAERQKIREKNAKKGHPDAPAILSAAQMSHTCGDPDTISHVVSLSAHVCWVERETGIKISSEIDCR